MDTVLDVSHTQGSARHVQRAAFRKAAEERKAASVAPDCSNAWPRNHLALSLKSARSAQRVGTPTRCAATLALKV